MDTSWQSLRLASVQVGRGLDVGPPVGRNSGSADVPLLPRRPRGAGRRHGLATPPPAPAERAPIALDLLLTVLAARAAFQARSPTPIRASAPSGSLVKPSCVAVASTSSARLRGADHLRHPRLPAAGRRRGRRRRAPRAGRGHAGRLRGRSAGRGHLPITDVCRASRSSSAVSCCRARPRTWPGRGHLRARRIQLAADGARQARVSTQRVKQLDYVTAARALGVGPPGWCLPAHRPQRWSARSSSSPAPTRACSSPPRPS